LNLKVTSGPIRLNLDVHVRNVVHVLCLSLRRASCKRNGQTAMLETVLLVGKLRDWQNWLYAGPLALLFIILIQPTRSHPIAYIYAQRAAKLLLDIRHSSPAVHLLLHTGIIFSHAIYFYFYQLNGIF